MKENKTPWVNVAIFDEEQRELGTLAFYTMADIIEYNTVSDIITTNIRHLEAALDVWDHEQIKHDENERYDRNLKALERKLGRELTDAEWDGKVPLGWSGTEEEYKEWERNYIESRKHSND